MEHRLNSSLGFYIGSFFIAYYGIMILLGIAAAAAVAWFQVRKYQMRYDDFIIIAAVSGLCGIIGAKLLYILVSFKEIDFSRVLELTYFNSIMSGGFVFYGGLIGGILGFFICKRIFHIDVFSYIEIAIPCLPIAHGFGRIGCSLVGCCYGRPYNGWGAIRYQESLFAPNQMSLFPVQMTEAVLEFLIAAILLVCINRYSSKNGLKWYLLMYAVVRLILEFFRYDFKERGLFMGLSTSQYISIVIIIGVLVAHILQKKKSKGGHNKSEDNRAC